MIFEVLFINFTIIYLLFKSHEYTEINIKLKKMAGNKMVFADFLKLRH